MFTSEFAVINLRYYSRALFEINFIILPSFLYFAKTPIM